MRLSYTAVLSALLVCAGVSGCSPVTLGESHGDGLVVVEARVAVKCVHSGYVTPAAWEFSGPSPLGKDSGASQFLARGSGRHDGGVYTEPPCVDAPFHFAADTNVADRVWIGDGSRVLAGDRLDGLLVVRGVPPGEWKVESVQVNFSFGGLDYVADIPGMDHRSVRLPETTIHVISGQVAYAGVLTIHAERDAAYQDSVSASYQYDPTAELATWKQVLANYPATPWADAIRARIAKLQH